MNSINFIKTVSAHQEREIGIWYRLTTLAVSALLTVIATYTTAQYWLYHSLTQEINGIQQELSRFDTIVVQQRAQTDEQALLQKKINAILKYRQRPKSPLDLLQKLRVIMTDNLQNVTIEKNNLELQVLCQSTRHATAYLQRLVHVPHMQTVKLVSLQSHKKRVIALFKGKITT